MTKLLFILLLLFGCSPTEPEDDYGCSAELSSCDTVDDWYIDNPDESESK